MSKTSKSDQQGHEPEAGAARPQQEFGAAPAPSGSPPSVNCKPFSGS
jgi:hypothetical protein